MFEDSAALVGLVFAAIGLGLSHLTGSALWDGLASVLIGLLLLVVAVVLARANMSMLVGRSVPEPLEQIILAELRAVPTVIEVYELYTQQLGIGSVLVAAKVDFVDTVTAADVEAACGLAEQRLRAVLPPIRHVFLDPAGARS